MAKKLYDNSKAKYKVVTLIEALLDGKILHTKEGRYLAMDLKTHKFGFLRLDNDNMKEPYENADGDYEILYIWNQDLNELIDWVDAIPDDDFMLLITQARFNEAKER